MIDEVIAHPEDLPKIKKACDALEAVEEMLRSLASEPLARVVSLSELDKACVPITRDIAFAKIKVHCLKRINSLYRESKRLMSPDSLDVMEDSDKSLPMVLEMKMDLDELKGLDKLDFELNLCSIRIMHQWSTARIENGVMAEKRDGNGLRRIKEFREYIVNLKLPENFKVEDIVKKADEKIKELTEEKQKRMEANGGMDNLLDQYDEKFSYVLSPRRNGNKTLPMHLARSTSEAVLDEKSLMHGNRRQNLQAQASRLAAQLLPMQRELELTIMRLDKIDEEEDDDLQVFKPKRHLPMSRIYQRALKNSLHDGDLQDVADIYKHLRDLRSPIPTELNAAASKVYARLSKISSGDGVSDAFRMNIAIRNSYRDLVLHYRKVGDEQMALRYCSLYRDARRAQLGTNDKEGKKSITEIRESIA